MFGLMAIAPNDFRGIPMLSLTNDPPLQALAQRDVKKPNDPEAKVELGDAWLNFAHSRGETERPEWLSRARFWYGRL